MGDVLTLANGYFETYPSSCLAMGLVKLSGLLVMLSYSIETCQKGCEEGKLTNVIGFRQFFQRMFDISEFTSDQCCEFFL